MSRTIPDPATRAGALDLLREFSLELTGKDAAALREASATIPAGTHINITYLATEDLDTRVAAAATIVELGFVPVPHIAARRLGSTEELEQFLDRLQQVGASERVFVVAGDPHEPEGPFADALTVITSGILKRYGVRAVGISGYPDGHPAISAERLWRALEDKVSTLAGADHDVSVTTQFGFDAAAVRTWIGQVRERGVTVPIRIGVPGPAGVRRLLGYARRFGVASSAGVVQKYGFSITNLLGTAGPDQFVAEIAASSAGGNAGDVRLHLYTFGGLSATARWAIAFKDAQEGPAR